MSPKAKPSLQPKKNKPSRKGDSRKIGNFARNITATTSIAKENKLASSKTRVKANKNNVLLRSIMENPQGVVIFSLDRDFCYTAFTITHKETMKTLWGVDIEIGMNILNAINDPLDREKAKNNFERAFHGEQFILIEEYGNPENYHTYYEDRYSPIIEKNGHVSGITVFVTDITDHKHTENALIAAETKYRMLVERLPVAVYTSELGVNGVWHYISPQIEELLGFTVAEWLSQPNLWYQQMHPEDRERQKELEEQAWTQQRTFEGEYRMFTREGRLIWIRDSAQILSPQNNSVPIVQGILMDITARKFAENALAVSETELRALFTAMQDVVLVIDRDGVYREIAPTSPDLLYKPSQEMLGKNLWDIFPTEQAEAFNAAIQQVLKTGQTARIEYSLSIGDHLKWFATSISPMDADNTIWVARDITDRKHAEQMQLALYEIANVAQTTTSLNDLFASIHITLGTFMPAENFYIAIYDEKNDLLSFPYFVDQYDKAPAPHEPSSGLTEYVLHTRQPLMVTSQILDDLISKKLVTSVGTASSNWIGVPLTVGEETFGVMVVQTYSEKLNLAQKELDILIFVSTQTAMVIKRKQAEETLLQFRGVMDESNDAIFFIDPETSRYIDFNKNAMEFLGYAKEELSLLGVIHIAEHVNTMKDWRGRVDLIGKSNGLVFQTSYRRKDETLFPVEVSARILEYDNKPIMVAVVRDITDRTQAEAARERQLAELTGLHAIASSCAFASDEDSLISVVTIIIEEVLFPEDFGFFMMDKDGLLRPHPSYHPNNGKSNEYIRLGEGLIGQAAADGKARRSGDVRLEKNYIAVSPTSLSELAIPVKINERVLGVINAESNKLNAFSEADERLLGTAADQIATALERIYLQNETNQRAKEFASLYETSNALSAENDLTALLQVIVDHAATLLNASNGAIYLFNKPTQDLETVVATSSDIPIGTHLHLGEGVAGRVAENQMPLRVNDYSTWEGRSSKFDAHIFRAILEVPMLFGGELIGVLTAAEMGESNRKFSEADERLLSLFAAQAAGAIHSARLRNKTAKRAQEFASLYETSKTLSTEHNLNTLLRSIVENAKNLLHTATSGMYLTVPNRDELELSMDSAPYIPLGSRMRLGEGVAGRVAQTRQPLRIDDYSTWEGQSELYKADPIRAILEVPMLYRGELIGVLTANEAGDSDRKFTEEDEHLLSLFASQAAGAIHAARLFEETRHRAEEFTSLYETTHDLAMQQDLSVVMDIITKRTTALLGVPNAAIILFDPVQGDLHIAATIGPDLLVGTRRKLGEGLAGRVAQSRLPMIIDDYQHWEHRSHQYDSIPYTAMMGIPLLYGGNLLGVLDVSDVAPSKRTFNETDVRLLSLFAGQAASAIANAQLFEDLKKSNFNLMSAYDTTIEGWSRAMDLRDHETEGHTLRVTDLTLKLARRMNLSESQLMHIRRGSLLHDIGKMGIPDAILLKDGNLTDEEWIIMRKHPQFAFDMLSSIDYLHDALDIPANHHEKWDGTGYPRGLKCDEIPLSARIFAVVDVWDAIRSDRPYRKGWNTEKAIEYINSQSGTHFDPVIVVSFLDVLREE